MNLFGRTGESRVSATLADILGTKLPDNAGEDSFSLLPLLRGEDTPIRVHAISCAMSGVPALLRGAWKLIAAASGSGGFAEQPPREPATPVLLYTLADALGETRTWLPSSPSASPK